jgi:disulfide bond formation protein DsbB
VRIEFVLWAGVTLHFALVGVLYAFIGDDPAGAALLLVAAGLGGLVAGWTWSWRRRHHQPRPEDVLDADATDATGVVGVYPTASLRPLALAAGMTAAVLGVPLGSWMAIAGIAIIASQVALLTRDADQ